MRSIYSALNGIANTKQLFFLQKRCIYLNAKITGLDEDFSLVKAKRRIKEEIYLFP